MNVVLPRGELVDLNAALGVPAGTLLTVQNLSRFRVRLYPDAVPSENNFNLLLGPAAFLGNDASDTGCFARCHLGGIINVQRR